MIGFASWTYHDATCKVPATRRRNPVIAISPGFKADPGGTLFVYEAVFECGPAKGGGVNEKFADDVYRRLRQDIIRGVVRPNEALVETELAKRLNVSRTPVRETLHRLAADGLIVSRRRRWHVYEHSHEEIRQIYEVRAALEGYAARLACRRGTEAQFQALADARDEPEETSAHEHVEHNERFHDLIVVAAGNDRLAAQIRGNRLYFFNYRLATLYSPDDVGEYARQHTELVKAVTSRDADRAERLTHEHIDHALNLILTKLH